MSLLVKIAEACHEANRALCESLNDKTQAPWAKAPGWQKESTIAGISAILDGRVKSPEESHEGWLAAKEAEGWKYGEKKDAKAKTHPCFLPFDELPPEQQLKDQIFFAIASAFKEKY